jgi:hypothetical protein
MNKARTVLQEPPDLMTASQGFALPRDELGANHPHETDEQKEKRLPGQACQLSTNTRAETRKM